MKVPAVHLWLHGPDPAPPAGMLDCLSPDELAQARRFVRPEDRRQRLAASAYRRLLLGHALDCDPATLRFATHPLGKPCLVPCAGRAAPEFNVSHCAGAIAVALAEGPVGIDAEFAGAAQFEWDVASLCFNPDERAALASAGAGRRSLHAFALWTIKEALLKASGHGLERAPLEVDSGIGPGGGPFGVRLVRFDRREWRVETQLVADHWPVSVATPAMAGPPGWHVGAHGRPPHLGGANA